jgi:hypothetical protein
MNVYDQAEHEAILLEPQGQLRWFLAGLDPDLGFARWLQTQSSGTPGDKERRADLVAEFVSRSGTQAPWACLVEAQGQQQTDLLLRALEYLARLGQELRHGPHGRDRYLMMALILNLAEYVEEDTLNWTPPVSGKAKGLNWHLWVWNLLGESASATLDAIESGAAHRCILVWVSLMKEAAEPELIQRWRRLAEQEPDPILRASYAALALVFAEKVGREEVWRKELEGFNVQESKIVKEWQEQARKVTKREDVLRLLQVRFTQPLPTEVTTAIEQQNDLDVLSTWFDLAATSGTVEQFRAAISGINGAAR